MALSMWAMKYSNGSAQKPLYIEARLEQDQSGGSASAATSGLLARHLVRAFEFELFDFN